MFAVIDLFHNLEKLPRLPKIMSLGSLGKIFGKIIGYGTGLM